jgi:exonuclease III
VRVVTFNINNINKRLDNLLAWLSKAEPDVVSLQELKAEQEAFPVNATSNSRVRSGLARGALLERRGHSRAKPRSRADLHKLAGKS